MNKVEEAIGISVGTDTIDVYPTVIEAMSQDDRNAIDVGYVRLCLMANQNNALTSYYHLLAKKMAHEGKPLVADAPIQAIIPKEKAVKKY